MKKLMAAALALLTLTGVCEAKANDNKNQKTNMKTIALNKADFLKKVADYENNPETWKYLGDKPALIDFYATWCGPCKKIAPILEELAGEYDGKIVVGKCDVDENDELAAQYGIRNIPTVLFIKNGEIVDKHVGAAPKSAFDEKFKALL